MRLTPIVVLILATTLIRFAFAATTGLGVDESYMIAAGRHFAFSYFDHPPLSWWLSHGAAVLVGAEASVVVRAPFILLFALSQWLTFLIGRRVGGERAGFWAVVALNLSPVFGLTTGTWVLPDGPLDCGLLAAVACLMRALSPAEGCDGGNSPVTPGHDGGRWANEGGLADGGRIGWWLAAGACAGLAMLSKYSAVLVIGGAFLFFLATPSHRRLLARSGPYLAVLAAATVFSPVLIWNARHGWASFAFQGDRALGLQFHPLAPLTTLGGEALFVLPWIWAPMMLLLIRTFRAGAPWPDRLLAWLAIPPIVLFVVLSLWSRQRILFHWAAPGYLMLFPLLGRAMAEREGVPWVRRTVRVTAALLLGAMLIMATQIQLDWLGPGLALLKRDPTLEGMNWASVRDDLLARGLLPADTVAAAFNWRDAGKFGYALGPAVRMLCLSGDAREFRFTAPPARFAGQTVLLLSLDPPARAAAVAAPWFASVDLLPGASVRLQGRQLAPVTILLGHGLRATPQSEAGRS
ncbi:MAG TPA: glycosyltransferase family 39 protein [Rhodopila sp.]|uniref:glycosyltransferase family 39 protein n=1 Tax=Rhodopila sp. TaxID=2480087 RepID=UPI002CC22DE1|nr:glycosyltransferase family 39 protein [Rhodopila sp.]HVY15915.1 glycosyltransferase family 39 protein [Rhodopila sp.]